MSDDKLKFFISSACGKKCAAAAGNYFQELLQDPIVAKTYLYHPDPQARLGALLVLKHYWPKLEDFLISCEKLAFNDTELSVRCTALISIAADCKAGDKRLGKMFAEVVRDEAQPKDFRYIAYLGLYSVADRLKEAAAMLPFDFPSQIDWPFVDSFLNEPDIISKDSPDSVNNSS